MRVLRSHHILPLFCMVDDSLETRATRRGRKATLRDSEVVTILAFNMLTVQTVNPASGIRLDSSVPQLRLSSLTELPELCETLPPAHP